LSWFTRAYFAVVGLVGLVTGAVLLLAPDTTAEYFAWSISPTQTAVFMGAGYLGTGITMMIGLILALTWLDGRLIIPPILAFAVFMVAATLLHADRFLWTRLITWLWLGLYNLIVLGGLVVLWAERGNRGKETAAPIRDAERAALLLVGIATACWAIPLFVAPSAVAELWPWLLTPLTARVVAGWVGVAAVLAVVSAVANDYVALRLPLMGWTITVILFLVASALNRSAFSPGDVRSVVYFLALGLSVAGSVWLLMRVNRRRHRVI